MFAYLAHVTVFFPARRDAKYRSRGRYTNIFVIYFMSFANDANFWSCFYKRAQNFDKRAREDK